MWQSRDYHRRSTSRLLVKHRISSADQSTSWTWTIRHPSSIICSTAENSFVSGDLAKKLRLGLEELATVREQLTPLISLPATSAGVIERAAACAMLHSFYTEIEKLLKLIAREWDGQMPSSEVW